jgi:hypothetical protein
MFFKKMKFTHILTSSKTIDVMFLVSNILVDLFDTSFKILGLESQIAFVCF